MCRGFWLLSFLAISCVHMTATADDWKQWRGNDRDGKSAETGLLESWPSQGPPLVWQADGIGNGYSTPAAASGKLYLLRNKDQANEELIALSLADGRQIWATRVGSVGENRGPQYPGARSTPTVDGTRVYALGSDGDLACVEADSGEIVWARNLRTDFDGKPGAWAYAESPLIDGDVLLCSPGGASATVVALNKQDGSVIWKSTLADQDNASFSSPIATTIGGVKQYVLYLSKGVVGLSADDGRLLWRYSNTADKDANIQTPVASEGRVYTAAGRVGGGLVQISGNQYSAEELYFAKAMPSGMGGCVLVDGKLYGSSGQTLMCIDFASGEVEWQDRSIGAASLCYAEGKLYAHGENNEMALVAAEAEGYRELGRFTPSPAAEQRPAGKAWAYPIIADGKLVIRDAGTIWCYNIRR